MRKTYKVHTQYEKPSNPKIQKILIKKPIAGNPGQLGHGNRPLFSSQGRRRLRSSTGTRERNQNGAVGRPQRAGELTNPERESRSMREPGIEIKMALRICQVGVD